MEILNNKQIRYVIIRGYRTLPKTPDTDIDLVCHRDDYKNLVGVVHDFWELNTNFTTPLNFRIDGKDCEYTQWRTTGKEDSEIANGRFTMDTYNHFFFHRKEKVVLSDEFADEIFSKGIQKRNNYFILKPEYEVLMYGYRNVFDLQNKFKKKHIDIIRELLNQNPLLQSIEAFAMKDSRTSHVIKQVFAHI